MRKNGGDSSLKWSGYNWPRCRWDVVAAASRCRVILSSRRKSASSASVSILGLGGAGAAAASVVGLGGAGAAAASDSVSDWPWPVAALYAVSRTLVTLLRMKAFGVTRLVHLADRWCPNE